MGTSAAEEILGGADIVAATCVGAGDPRLAPCNFKLCALDEASQATEPAALIPLLSQCQAAVLVGDPCQLPPTVVSRRVRYLHYCDHHLHQGENEKETYCEAKIQTRNKQILKP